MWLLFLRFFLLQIVLIVSLLAGYASPPLSNQLTKAKSDTSRLAICIKLIQFYKDQGKSDSCQLFIDQGLKLVDKTTITYYHSRLYFIYGDYLNDLGQIQKSVKVLKEGAYWAEKNKQSDVLVKINYRLATIYSAIALASNKQKDFTVAISQIHKNINFSNRYNISIAEGSNYALLANMYGQYHSDSLAYKFLQKSVSLLEKTKTNDVFEMYILLCKFQIDLFYKRFSRANINLHNLVKLRNKTTTYNSAAYLGLVRAYSELGYPEQVIKVGTSFQEKDKVMASMPSQDKLLLFSYLTSAYLSKRDYGKAKQNNEKCKLYITSSATTELNVPIEIKIRLLKNELELLGQQNQFRQAFRVAKELEMLKDSLNLNRHIFELAASQERLDRQVEESDLLRQVKLHKLENIYNAKSLDQSRKIQWLSFLIILILVVLVLVEIFQIKKSKKQSNELAILNATQNKIFGIISHDLRSPVAGLHSLLRIINNDYYSKKSQTAFSHLEMQIGIVSNTLDNLLNWSVAQMGGLRPKIQKISLQDSIDHILELSNYAIQYKSIIILENVESAYVLADENLTDVVIRNVISNAIKFTPEHGVIKLSSNNNDDEYIFQIQDSGLGMTETRIENIFFDYSSQKGTIGEKGSGLGLKLCKDLMTLQGGRIEILSKVNEGTLVKLTFKSA